MNAESKNTGDVAAAPSRRQSEQDIQGAVCKKPMEELSSSGSQQPNTPLNPHLLDLESRIARKEIVRERIEGEYANLGAKMRNIEEGISLSVPQQAGSTSPIPQGVGEKRREEVPSSSSLQPNNSLRQNLVALDARMANKDIVRERIIGEYVSVGQKTNNVDATVSLSVPPQAGEVSPRAPPPQLGTPGAIHVAGIGATTYQSEEEVWDDDAVQISAPFEPDHPVQATLVRDPSSLEFRPYVQAQPMDSSHLENIDEAQLTDILRNKKIRAILMVGICTIVLLIVAVSVGLSTRTTDDSTSAPTAVDRPLPPFSDQLDDFAIGEIKTNPASPYARANEWILSDPNLDRLSVERRLARYGLAAEFFAVGGDAWNHKDNWLDYNVHECDWYTAHPESICNERGEFLVWNLTGNNLTGTLTGRTGRYVPFQIVDLSNNSLTGMPPFLFSNRSKLAHMDVSNNLFDGRLLVEVGWKNEHMKVIRIQDNRIAGFIAPVLELFPNVVELDFSSNQFSGDVPAFFLVKNNSYLSVLNMADNLLQGSLPAALGYLTELKVFNVSGNHQISGTIPSEMANLPFEVLDVSGTSLSGSIPKEICRSKAAAALNLVADCDGELQCC